jgi:secondary thiamine-phosphate synthase enzyme
VSAYAELLTVRSKRREQALEVTARVREVVKKARVRVGVCVVYTQHTTAGVFVNENADPDVLTDLLAALRRSVPDDAGYRHAEGNAPAHIRSVLTGASACVPVAEGDLALGTWQGVFLVDFDGPRERRILVTIIGE